MSIEREATVRWCTEYFRFLLNRARPGLIVSLAKPRREIRSPKAVTGAEVSLHEPNCRLCVFQEAAMSREQAPGIPCAVCGRGLHLGDIVIVSREVPPSWALPVEQTMTAIVHQACEPGGGRADHNWMREAPQTVLHMLVRLADGRDQQLEPGGA